MVPAVPEDDKPRRLGDETKGRIDNLSSGWSIEAVERTATPDVELSKLPARKKPRTVPPPPPGSAERKALEQAIVETKDGQAVPRIALTDVKPEASGSRSIPDHRVPQPAVERASGAVRAKPVGAPPPIPRAKQTVPPPIPPLPNTAGAVAGLEPAASASKSGTVVDAAPLPISQRLPLSPDRPPPPTVAPVISVPTPRPAAVLIDNSATIPDAAPPLVPKLAVPVGEFDSGSNEDKLRLAYSQSTLKRDASEALLGLPRSPSAIVKAPSVERPVGETASSSRGDPSSIDPHTVPFERGDPTVGERPDATMIESPSLHRSHSGGTLRTAAALRRQRGILGDVLYVATALFGMRGARRELAELERRQETRQLSRRRHLVTLGRTAAITDSFDHPAVAKTRELLGAIEEERSQHAGSVAAADTELNRVRRERAAKAKQYVIDISALEAELASITKKLEPLEKEAAVIRKRADELRDATRRIEKAISDSQASLVSVKGPKQERAAILAEIATHKADLKSVNRDEPAIAAELDALNPRIAALEASRGDAQKRKIELQAAEAEDQRRTAELLEAIGAKRKVVGRAAGDAETARDRILFELGDRLHVDRPAVLTPQLSPIDQIDLELGESDRRVMELREIQSNLDRTKLYRGIALVVSAAIIVGSMIAWLLYMLP